MSTTAEESATGLRRPAKQARTRATVSRGGFDGNFNMTGWRTVRRQRQRLRRMIHYGRLLRVSTADGPTNTDGCCCADVFISSENENIISAAPRTKINDLNARVRTRTMHRRGSTTGRNVIIVHRNVVVVIKRFVISLSYYYIACNQPHSPVTTVSLVTVR